MNKLAIVLLLAGLVGCAFGAQLVEQNAGQIDESQLIGDDLEGEEFSYAVFPNDDLETAYLTEENRIFSDFCLKSRDEIKMFLNATAQGAAASVFDVIFGSFSDIGRDLVEAQKAAAETGAESIRNPVVTADGEQQSLLQSVSEAARSAINAVIESVREDVFQRLTLLKARFSLDTIKDTIRQSCNSISFDLANKIESRLATTKAELRASASKNPTLRMVVQRAQVDNIGCLSAGRVSKVAKFCNILTTVAPSFYPLLGFN